MKKNVLLVDDELDILNFMETFLGRLNVLSVKASSGKQAIKSYDKKFIDLVFLDLQLSDMSGFDVLKELKKENPSVKVIMITGKAEKDFEDRARELGVIDYITKPLDLSDLQVKVNKFLI